MKRACAGGQAYSLARRSARAWSLGMTMLETGMLFLVISEPRPERPSSVTVSRRSYWTWIKPLIDAGEVESVHAKVGRGAVVLFNVASNEVLHAHLNAWADIIPATFEVHALIDPIAARRFLDEQGAAPV